MTSSDEDVTSATFTLGRVLFVFGCEQHPDIPFAAATCVVDSDIYTPKKMCQYYFGYNGAYSSSKHPDQHQLIHQHIMGSVCVENLFPQPRTLTQLTT